MIAHSRWAFISQHALSAGTAQHLDGWPEVDDRTALQTPLADRADTGSAVECRRNRDWLPSTPGHLWPMARSENPDAGASSASWRQNRLSVDTIGTPGCGGPSGHAQHHPKDRGGRSLGVHLTRLGAAAHAAGAGSTTSTAATAWPRASDGVHLHDRHRPGVRHRVQRVSLRPLA